MASEPSKLLSLMIGLDEYLTGKTTPLHQRLAGDFIDLDEVAFGSGNIFYLSDGGYSRLVWNQTQETLNPTRGEGGSLAKVLERWEHPEAQRLKAEIEALLHARILEVTRP